MGTAKYLHIEKLRERFRGQKAISVDDFCDFYEDVFGEINKNTVNWYIYELKNGKVIKWLSRGLYALEVDSDESKKDYIVITMDIVSSSKAKYEEFNEELKSKVRRMNEILKEQLKIDRSFYISQGDEMQLLCEFDDNLGRLLLLFFGILHPYKVRYGISIGEVNGEIKSNSWEMNGPIFWGARDQLMKLKKGKRYDGLIASGYSRTDRICNEILPLVNNAINRITKKQWEAMEYDLLNKDFEEAANELNIKKTSYYERLNSANVDEILSAISAIYRLLKARRAIS